MNEPQEISVPDEKANILIVDDRPDKRLVFQTVLEDLGQNIVTARSGEEALRWLLDHECAVILLDVNMPGMDGLEAAELIRGRRRSMHTPIIFITAYTDEIHTARGYSLGAVDYIQAPVLPNVLRSKVNAFVRLFKLTAQLRRQADERIILAREQAARAAAEESTRRANFLANASKVMSSSLDLNAILSGATQLAVPFLADFSSVMLFNEDGSVRQTETAWSVDWEPMQQNGRELLDALLDQALARVASTGVREIIPDAPSTVASYPLARLPVTPGDSHLPFGQIGVFPLIAGGRTRGILAFVLKHSDRRFDPAELVLAEDVAGRVAMALDNCLLYQEIQNTDRRKNEFLATLGHELRNPLAPLRTALHLMRVGGTSETEAARLRSMMERQVSHMARLVDDLLDVARITSGKVELRKERIDLVVEMRNALETCKATDGAAARDISVGLPAEPLWVDADPHRLQQILENLLMNAVKYTDMDGRIEVTVARDGAQAHIRVCDTGIGIAPDMLPRIWELFMQADTNSNRIRQGLGIGLSLAQSMVQLHGGSIEANSDGVGKGSAFTVRLPCLPSQGSALPAVAKSTHDAASPAISRRVLIVDDNADAAESLKLVLDMMGHQTELAFEGIEALRLAALFQPEIIFLDIGLPGMNGYEIATRIRHDLGMKTARLIALSGFGSEEDRRRSVKSGFDAHIVKPLDPDILPGVLAEYRTDQ